MTDFPFARTERPRLTIVVFSFERTWLRLMTVDGQMCTQFFTAEARRPSLSGDLAQ